MELILRQVLAPLFQRAGGLDKQSFYAIVRKIWWEAYCDEFFAARFWCNRLKGAGLNALLKELIMQLREGDRVLPLTCVISLEGLRVRISWSRHWRMQLWYQFQRWKLCKRRGCQCCLAFGGRSLAFERFFARTDKQRLEQQNDILMQEVKRLRELTEGQTETIRRLEEASKVLAKVVFDTSGNV